MSEQGLKTHKKRKHKTANKSDEILTYPKQCDLCEKDLKDKNDMKVHMKTHSYKRAEFKCEECEFYGESDLWKFILERIMGRSLNVDCVVLLLKIWKI